MWSIHKRPLVRLRLEFCGVTSSERQNPYRKMAAAHLGGSHFAVEGRMDTDRWGAPGLSALG